MRTSLKVMLALTLALAVCFVGQPSALAGESASITASSMQQAAAETYWTPERMAAARPFPMPVLSAAAAADVFDMAAVTGPAGRAPSGPPMPGANAIAKADYPEQWEAIEKAAPAAEVAGTAGVFTYYDVNKYTALWKIFPHTTVGRLYFQNQAGSGFYCSATVISNNHIVTAAHCLYDTTANQWYKNWVFTPAYRNGTGGAPYGTFAWATGRVLPNWINLSGSYNFTWVPYDVALLGLKVNSAGKTVNQMVGWAGRTWNNGYSQLHFNSGYPFKNYSNAYLTEAGYWLRACTAESFQGRTSGTGGTLIPETLGMGCFYGGGISGGSWLRAYKPLVGGATNYVNSVNSGIYIGVQNIYGARFNSNNIVYLCNLDGC